LAVYAIVRTGGKQYRIQQGATIDVERLAAPEGGRVELPDVLLLDEDGRVTVGTPTVPGVKVVAEVVSHGRGPKVIIFKYKAKTRYRKKTGHRQPFTRLAIQRIQVGEEEEKPARRRRARKAALPEPAVAEAAAEEPAVVSEAAAPEEQVEKKPAPRRRRKTAETPPTGE
jgi:large subunit ribosomal protein L21